MEYKVYVGGEDYTKNATFTVNEQDTIDLSLATGNLTLKGLSVENPFKPFTDVIITIENKRTLAYVISNDNVERVIAQNTYNHNISLIEQSKILERYQIVNRSVKNPTIHDFSELVDSRETSITMRYKYIWIWHSLMEFGAMRQFVAVGSQITIPSLVNLESEYRNDTGDRGHIGQGGYVAAEFVTYKYKLEVYENGVLVASTDNPNNTLNYTPQKAGAITISWKGYVNATLGAGMEASAVLTAYSQTETEVADITITDAVNKLLQVAETLRVSEIPRYHFNEEQATRYSSVICPEMNFNGSLWECLKQIGDVIHSVPRLRYDEIYFDEFGLEDELEEDISKYCISDAQTFSIDNFASALDSVVQNIVNTDNEDLGAIQEPFSNGYITPRAEYGEVIVTDTNCFIPTKYPIEKIIKLECGYSQNNNIGGDITTFVYEQTEYNNLTSYGASINSKAYAIYYKQGQKNIYGMNYRQPYQTSVGQLVEHPFSIRNILKYKTGSSDFDNIDIRDLQFRITYVPQTTIRARQYKVDVEDIQSNTIAYNQSANKISSIAYGEAMKGAIAKLGNPERTLVFILNDVDLINKIKCGIKYDDEYYISVVKVEWYKDFAKVSIGLSKGFNAISEYVGIKNELRHYEVTTETQNAYTVYGDFVVIGDEIEESEQTFRADVPLFHKITYPIYPAFESAKPDCVVVTCYENQENPVKTGTALLPIQTYTIGNSVVLSFQFEDNYSAGKFVTNVGGGKVQQDLTYGDVFGNVNNIQIEFARVNDEVWDADNWRYIDQIGSFDQAVGYGRMLPNSEVAYFPVLYTDDDNIVIDKGNAENICFSYQLNYVRNNKNIVIGKYLIENNELIKSNEFTTYSKIYGLTRDIGEYQTEIDLNSAIFIDDVIIEQSRCIMANIQSKTLENNIKAIAIVRDNHLLIGINNVNKSVITNDDLPYISVTHSFEKQKQFKIRMDATDTLLKVYKIVNGERVELNNLDIVNIGDEIVVNATPTRTLGYGELVKITVNGLEVQADVPFVATKPLHIISTIASGHYAFFTIDAELDSQQVVAKNAIKVNGEDVSTMTGGRLLIGTYTIEVKPHLMLEIINRNRIVVSHPRRVGVEYESYSTTVEVTENSMLTIKYKQSSL